MLAIADRARLLENFCALDTTRAGFLTLAKMDTGIACSGIVLPAPRIQLLEAMGADTNAKINFELFLDAC